MHAGLPLIGSSSLQAPWSTAWAWEGKAARRFPKGPQVGEGRTNTAEVRPGPGVGERCFRGVTWVDVTGWACLNRTGGVIPSRLTGKHGRTAWSHTGWHVPVPQAPQPVLGLGSEQASASPQTPLCSPTDCTCALAQLALWTRLNTVFLSAASALPGAAVGFPSVYTAWGLRNHLGPARAGILSLAAISL